MDTKLNQILSEHITKHFLNACLQSTFLVYNLAECVKKEYLCFVSLQK